MKKLLTCLVIALSLMAVPVPALGEQNAGDFADIKGHWAEKDIQTTCQIGLMSGVINGQGLRSFYPENTLNRAQLASALQRTFKLDYGSMVFIKAPQVGDYYRDVNDKAWYADAAMLCAINQVFDSGEYFQPEEQVTRIELARAVYRCFTAKGISIPMIMMMPVYKDTGGVAQEDMNAIVFVSNTGIMKGDGQNFYPREKVKRAELARVLARCASLMESDKEADKEVNENYNGQTLKVTAGETFVLSLDSNPTTGYDWSVAASWDEKVLNLLDKGYQQSGNSQLMGQGGKSYWKFKALQAGTTDLKLVYARPWESVQPQKTFQINIVVTSAAAAAPETVKIDCQEVKDEQEYKIVDLKIPVISGMADNKAQEAINLQLEDEAMNWKNEVEAGFDEYIKECKESDYPIRPYGLGSEYQLVSQNEQVLSFYIDYYQYTGGAHGLTDRRAYNIDLAKGEILSLKDLFQGSYDYKKVINEQIAREIKADPDGYFSGDMGFQGISDQQGFYLADGNLVVYFGQYEIAPYAAGMPEFKIPLQDLKDGLRAEFIN